MARILLVEDEPSIALAVTEALTAAGFAVQVVGDGERALREIEKEWPTLVLLDLMLPRIDGIEVCRRLKADCPELPVIMVTAKGQEIDKVVGLEIGADDYVVKPFGMRELLARIKAVLRRCQREYEHEPDTVTFGDVTVDFEGYQVKRKDDLHSLSALEAKMLRFFVGHRGKVVSRNDFLRHVWGYDRFPTTRTVDFHVLKLRQKIEPDPANPRHIQTVHGVGYKFQE
ncbi:MAG: response regulator transcription factor [Planctomycetota bacterium]